MDNYIRITDGIVDCILGLDTPPTPDTHPGTWVKHEGGSIPRIGSSFTDGEFIPPLEPPQDIVPWEVRKLLIIDRLYEVGLLDAALAALAQQDTYTQKRWDAAVVIASDDLIARALIQAVGGDPDAILAAE